MSTMIPMDLLNNLKQELEKEKRLKEKYKEVLTKIANGVDYSTSATPQALEKEDMVRLAIAALSFKK